MTEDSVRVGDIFARPLDLIDPDPNNRSTETPYARAHIAEIAASMVARGFDTDRAILVRKQRNGRWMVTDGHMRLAAAFLAVEMGANIKGIPCRSEAQGTTEEDRAILRLRDPGLAPTQLEAAEDIKRLMTWGWTRAKIALKLGKSESWVASCLDIAGTTIEIRQAVTENKVATTEALKIVREHGDDAGAVIEKAHANAVARGKKTATAKDVKAVTERPAPVRTDPPSLLSFAVAVVLAWEGGITSELDGALDQLAGHIGGAVLDAAREKMEIAA
jgi:ParB-like chromosome segregation protein Spo0J